MMTMMMMLVILMMLKILCLQKLVVTMGTFPTRGRDIVPVFIHRARVFSFLLDILDISSSSIYLFINILKLICFLYSLRDSA